MYLVYFHVLFTTMGECCSLSAHRIAVQGGQNSQGTPPGRARPAYAYMTASRNNSHMVRGGVLGEFCQTGHPGLAPRADKKSSF